jgi:NTE family protein
VSSVLNLKLSLIVFIKMKRLFFLLLILIFCVQEAVPQNLQRPKVAVVLSGGGAKGFAHIGVLKVLEEEGIPIDIIVGTSMGSIVGGLYSIGYSADSIARLARSENWAELLSDDIPRRELDQDSRIEKQRYLLKFPVSRDKKPEIPNGLINGQNIINLFCGLTANIPVNADFNKFPVEYACVATDMETGTEVVINSGFLPTAMFSSMAIPGIFVPGNHNGYTLIDGGLVNNFPADVAKSMGADIIIGVDVSAGLHSEDEMESIKDVMDQLINFYVLKKNSSNKEICNIIIHPDTKGYGVSSFNSSAVDTLIERGISAARKQINDIEKLKAAFNLTPEKVSRTLIEDNCWKIDNITFSGKYSMSDNYLEDVLELTIPGPHSYSDIKTSINNLYGTGNFKRAYFSLSGESTSRKLDIVLDEKKKWDINLGMRLNTTDAVSIVVNSTRKDYMKTFGLISFSADISSNPEASLLLEMDRKDMAKLSLRLEGMYKELDIHVNSKDYFPSDLFLASAELFLSQKIPGNITGGSGLKQEYYRGKFYGIMSDSLPVVTTREKSITHLFVYLSHDNLDNYYFPLKGTDFYTKISALTDKDFQDINPVVLVRSRSFIRLSRNYTALLNFYGRSLFSEKTPVQLGNFVGGHDYEISLENNLPFYGLPSFYVAQRQAFVGLIGVRARVTGNHYISAVGNMLLHSDELYPLNKFSSVSGYGLTYSYNSPIGPIELTAGYSEKHTSPVFSANIGLWF